MTKIVLPFPSARQNQAQRPSSVAFKARGLAAKDTSNAKVSLDRISLAFGEAEQHLVVSNVNPTRQLSEPRARLQFENKRDVERPSW